MGTLLNVPASISKQPELLLKNLLKQVQNDGMVVLNTPSTLG